MNKNNIINLNEEKSNFDKLQIALAIRNSTYECGLQCMLLEDNILSDCESCQLKPICEGLESLAQDYLVSTTKIVSSFNFQ